MIKETFSLVILLFLAKAYALNNEQKALYQQTRQQHYQEVLCEK